MNLQEFSENFYVDRYGDIGSGTKTLQNKNFQASPKILHKQINFDFMQHYYYFSTDFHKFDVKCYELYKQVIKSIVYTILKNNYCKIRTKEARIFFRSELHVCNNFFKQNISNTLLLQ